MDFLCAIARTRFEYAPRNAEMIMLHLLLLCFVFYLLCFLFFVVVAALFTSLLAIFTCQFGICFLVAGHTCTRLTKERNYFKCFIL